MRQIKSLFLTAAVLFSLGASAQSEKNMDYKPYPYGFIQAQGGVSTTFTNVNNFGKLLTPTYSLGVGAFFTPAVGARVHFNGYEQKGAYPNVAGTYHYKQATGDLDVLLNLNNILCPQRKNHFFNAILVAGVGLNYAWNNQNLDIDQNAYKALAYSQLWGKNSTEQKDNLSHNLRVGMLFDLNVAKHWNVGVEVAMNSLSDKFNAKYAGKDDWMMTAALSLTYKFGHKKVDTPAPVVDTRMADYLSSSKGEAANAAPVVTPAPAPAPAPVVKEEPLSDTLYYALRGSDVAPDKDLNAIVEWAKKYDDKKVYITGYADKGTGSRKVNMKYSKLRAEKVAKALQDKGLAADKMVVDYKGDTVQPFAENDANRCVIIEGK